MKSATHYAVALCAGFTFACGGSSSPATDTESPEPIAMSDQTVSEPVPYEPASDSADMTDEAEASAPDQSVEAQEDATASVGQDSPLMAEAELQATNGTKSYGKVVFQQSGDIVSIAGSFSGLKEGQRGFQIRENGSCENGGRAAGAHFNPTDSKHGPPSSAQRHAGDFGNLQVTESGEATFAMETDSVTVAKGPNSVVGRAVVVTARRDDGKTQPTGKAGKIIACGVVKGSEELAGK